MKSASPSDEYCATEHYPGYQKNLLPLSLALDAIPNPYYSVSKIHTSAPSCHDGPVWPCTGAPCPPHPPPTTAKASALASLMSGVANRNVTSK
jgi:hypothetical protein